MKTKIILAVLCLMFIVKGVKAQTDPLKGIMDAVGSQVGMGDLMGTLVNGIKPSAFTNGKSGKTDLLGQLSGISNASDYLGYAKVAGDLSGMLKSTSFLPDWAGKKDGILDQIQNASSIASLAGGLSDMTSLLNPSALSGSFKKNKSSFTQGLNLLKLVK